MLKIYYYFPDMPYSVSVNFVLKSILALALSKIDFLKYDKNSKIMDI